MNKELTPLQAVISLRTRLVEKGIKDEFLEELITIETALKALEIIKTKSIHIKLIISTSTVEDYNYGIKAIWSYKDEDDFEEYGQDELLTKEEYELLKEVLG